MVFLANDFELKRFTVFTYAPERLELVLHKFLSYCFLLFFQLIFLSVKSKNGLYLS